MKNYLNKISGPLLDRIDLHVEVTPVTFDEITNNQFTGESSSEIRRKMTKAKQIQGRRLQSKKAIHSNSQMNSRMVRDVCQ